MLNGERGSSKSYQLKGGSTIPFARGSITSFTLSLRDCIGPIKSVRVWHDNSGSSPSWYLNHIKTQDLSNQELKTFMCYTWLAVEKGDGLVDHTLTSDADEEKRMKFKVTRIIGDISTYKHSGRLLIHPPTDQKNSTVREFNLVLKQKSKATIFRKDNGLQMHVFIYITNYSLKSRRFCICFHRAFLVAVLTGCVC